MKQRDPYALLVQLRWLEECILIEYRSDNLCRDFVVWVDNIWTEDGKLRADLDTPSLLRLQFQNCQRIEIDNAFSRTILENSDSVNWSLNEFARVQIENLPDGLFRCSFLWERARRITIEYHTLMIEEVSAVE
jgi:hypothetical protein